MLRRRLRQIKPGQIPTLHSLASEWYEQNGQPPDAIQQALAARDFSRVASLAEMAWQAMDDSFQTATWLGWVKALPDELVRTRPVLSAQYAWALWMCGELEESETRLRDAERWLEIPADGVVVVDEEQFRTLPAKIALGRAQIAQAQGDVTGTVKYAQQATDLLSENDYFER